MLLLSDMSNTVVITLCRSSSLGLATSCCNHSQDQIVLSSCFGLFTCFGLVACLFSNSFYCTIITLRYRKPTKLTSISQNCYSEEGLLRNVTNKVICVEKWKSVKSFSISRSKNYTSEVLRSHSHLGHFTIIFRYDMSPITTRC